jgi:hypothetical protein
MTCESDAREWEKQGLRAAICGDLIGDEAYKALIEFDRDLSSDYGGFMEACQRVGLRVIPERAYERFWREIEADEFFDRD